MRQNADARRVYVCVIVGRREDLHLNQAWVPVYAKNAFIQQDAFIQQERMPLFKNKECLYSTTKTDCQHDSFNPMLSSDSWQSATPSDADEEEGILIPHKTQWDKQTYSGPAQG